MLREDCSQRERNRATAGIFLTEKFGFSHRIGAATLNHHQ
jgi:hypothetical protein